MLSVLSEFLAPILPEAILLGGILILAALSSRRLGLRAESVWLYTFGLLCVVLWALLYDPQEGLNLFKQGLGLDISLRTQALGGLLSCDVWSKLLKITLGGWALCYAGGMAAYRPLSQGALKATFASSELVAILLLAALVGSFLSVSAGDFRLFFLGEEILSLACLILLKVFERPGAGDITFRAFVLNGVGAGLILLGSAFFGALYGTLNIDSIAVHFQAVPPSLYHPFVLLAWAFIIFGCLAKMSLFPFHGLAIEVAKQVERPLFPLLEFLPRFVMTTVLLKLATLFRMGNFRALFLVIGVGSAVFGMLAAFRQNRLQPLLACLGLGQVGMLFVAIATTATTLFPSLFFMMLLTALATLVFVGSLLWAQARGRKVMTLGDLAFVKQESPTLAFLLGISFLSLVAFPLTPGFVPFLALAQSLIAEEALKTFAFVVVLESLGCFMGLRVVRTLMMPSSTGSSIKQERRISSAFPWGAVTLLGGMILMAGAADSVLTFFSLAETALEWYGK